LEKLTQTLSGKAFLVTLGLTLVVYLLRGVGLLSIMPGYILLLLIVLCFIGGWVIALRR
jgi:hypothetical protein